MNYEFEKRWWAILILPSFMISIALMTIHFLSKATERNAESPSGGVVFSLILIPALFVSAIGFIIPLTQMLTTFSAAGITRNYLLWKKHISWESIEEAILTEPNSYSRMIHIKLVGENRKFQINPFYYRDAERLFELFDNQMRRYKN